MTNSDLIKSILTQPPYTCPPSPTLVGSVEYNPTSQHFQTRGFYSNSRSMGTKAVVDSIKVIKVENIGNFIYDCTQEVVKTSDTRITCIITETCDIIKPIGQKTLPNQVISNVDGPFDCTPIEKLGLQDSLIY